MKVFISYRRRDGGKAYAYLICQKLRSLGIQVFFDLDSLKYKNSSYQEEINNNIKNCDYFLLLLQPRMFQNLDGDVFIKEICLAHELEKTIIGISLNEKFNWKDEQPLPITLEAIKLQNLQHMASLRLSQIDNFMRELVGHFEHHPNQINYYHFLLTIKENSAFSYSIPESTITNVPFKIRWNDAKRVSLLAVGCGSILGQFYTTVSEMLKQGCEFRFISVDQKGKSCKDIEEKKIYNATKKDGKGYLKQRQKLSMTVIQSMKEDSKMPEKYKNNIGYRVTNEHITMTLQWVESKCDENSYIFASFLPTVATYQEQARSSSVMVTRTSPLYDFFAKQFNVIWENAKVII